MMVLYVAGAIAALTFYFMYGKKPRSNYSFPTNDKDPNASATRRNYLNKQLVECPAGCSTLYESFTMATKNAPKADCFGNRSIKRTENRDCVLNGIERKNWTFYEKTPFEWWSFQKSYDICTEFASGLRSLGLNPQDKLAIFEETRLEWTIAEQACYMQNIIVLTVYANLGLESLVYALSQAKITHIFTNGSLLPQLLHVKEQCQSLEHIIYTDSPNEDAKAKLEQKGLKLYSFEQILEQGRQSPKAHTPPSPQDLACIMYTSGSTGVPKGVMITHANMISAVGGFGSCFSVVDGDTYLNYLPLAHVLAMVVENAVIHYGARMGFGNPKTLTEENMVDGCLGDMRELAPTAMAGVPLVFDRINAGIKKKIQQESIVKRVIFNIAITIKQWAFKKGRPTPLLNKIVFDQFKTGLGGKMRFMVSGGAPLSTSCQLFLESCFGIPILQGYGLTETCGAGTVMLMDDRSQGTVGPPVPCVEIKLVDTPEMGYTQNDKPNARGEVWIRGPCITKGYYLNPDLTKEAFTEDGWFKTGDIGIWNANGTLSIIDRIKNLVKGPTGEYIALEKLEAIFKNSTFVVNCCVYADRLKPIVIAIVQPQPIPVKKWLEANNKANSDFTKEEGLAKAVKDDLNKVGGAAGLKGFERVTHVILVKEEWAPDNNMLTAAMKLNRRRITTNYDGRIQRIIKK